MEQALGAAQSTTHEREELVADLGVVGGGGGEGECEEECERGSGEGWVAVLV
jgi:hypothetical protein